MLFQNHSFVCYAFSRFYHAYAPPVVLLLALLVGLAWTTRWTPARAAAPEIDVYYGNSAIADGRTTVDSNDCTNFGYANIDGVGQSCGYTIYNNGTADLHNVAVTIVGAAQASFMVDSAPETAIAPSGYTYFYVTFYPKTVGIHNAAIQITSNDSDETPYTFVIRGTTIPAEIDIHCHDTSVSIPSGSTTPSSNDCTDFGNANVDGTGNGYTFDIYNLGNDYLRDVTVTITGADAEHFSLYDPNGASYVIAPDSTGYFSLYFTPKSAGVHQATVSIASSDSDEDPYTFVIQGTATPAEINLACGNGVAIADGSTTPSTNDCTDLGTANVDNNYTTNAQFDIHNTGNDYLRDVVVTITGAGAEHFYLYNPNSDTIGPESSGYFNIYFIPKAAGIHQATVSIASRDSDENPYTFVVQGTATPAEIEVTTETGVPIPRGSRTPSVSNCTDFGATEIYQIVTYCRFVIVNQGNDYLRNVKAEVTGANADAFLFYQSPGETIAPESADQIILYFYPAKVGLHKAVVTITSSDSDETPYTFAIQGKATGPVTIALSAEPATPARNFRFTTNSRGSLGSSFYLDSDVYYNSHWPYGDTDGDGIWYTKTSDGIAAGNYHITAQLPFFWSVYDITCDNPALTTMVGPSVNFNLNNSTGLSCTYTLKRNAMIRVQNFHDKNGNGRRNGTEPYLPNWRFTLQESSGAVIRTLTTNDQGKGSFTDLPAGDYTICVEVPTGWHSTVPGSAPACYTRTVTWGNLLTLNFGNRETSVTAAEAEGNDVVATPDESLTTPDDAELSEGDKMWLTTTESTDTTEATQHLYLPAVMR